MKSLFTGCISAAIFLILGTFAWQACKKPSEGVEVTVNTNLYTSPMVFRFVNAGTDNTKQPGSFSITITGPDADAVVTAEGSKTFKVQDGVMALALLKSAAPSTRHPVSFSLIANVDGFTPVVQNVTIVSEGAYTQEVKLVEYEKPAPGTAVRLFETTLNAGVLTNAVSISTSANATTTETATITLPAGTKFYAANNTQLTSGNLSAKLVYYSAVHQNALNAFPGGFNANDIIGQDGKTIAGGATFVTAGFLAVNMKVGSTVVKSFSQNLQVSMDINKTLINPNTGNAVKEGDVIPIWSLDETTGQWKFEANGTVAAVGGKLVMQYNMGHLSYWNIDWAYYKNGPSTCFKEFKVMVNTPKPFFGKVYLATAGGQQLTYSSGGYSLINSGESLSFGGVAPSMGGVKIVVADKDGKILAESPGFNLCDVSGAVTVTIPSTTVFPESSYLEMDVTAKCTNKSIVAKVSGIVSLYVWNGSSYVYYNTVYIYNGKASFLVLNNQRYRVDTYYGNKPYSATIDFKSVDSKFSGSTANASLTGTSVYDKNRNTYSVNATVAVTCN
jgi:hypothetical protein